MKEEEFKICVVCGEKFYRTIYKSGNRESVTKFRLRPTCGRSCSHDVCEKTRAKNRADVFKLAQQRKKESRLDGWLCGAL
jgi:hypothetical protein